MASDINKPDGQAVITPGRGAAFVAALPVAKFHGVGPATAAKMERLGIRTGADLKARDPVVPAGALRQERALVFQHRARRRRAPRPAASARASPSGRRTRSARTSSMSGAAREEVAALAAKVWRECSTRDLRGRTVTLKVKYADFRQITRSRTMSAPFQSEGRARRDGSGAAGAAVPAERGRPASWA
jgi:DNA polymerase-4